MSKCSNHSKLDTLRVFLKSIKNKTEDQILFTNSTIKQIGKAIPISKIAISKPTPTVKHTDSNINDKIVKIF